MVDNHSFIWLGHYGEAYSHVRNMYFCVEKYQWAAQTFSIYLPLYTSVWVLLFLVISVIQNWLLFKCRVRVYSPWLLLNTNDLVLHFCTSEVLYCCLIDCFCGWYCVLETRRLQTTWAVMATWMLWKLSKRKQICQEKWRGNMGVCLRRNGPLLSGYRKRCVFYYDCMLRLTEKTLL